MALKQKLAELIVDINAKLSPLKGQLAKANAMMKRGLASMVRMSRRAGKWIAVGLVAALAWATRAAMVQEDAEINLAAALRQTGDATKENIKRFKDFASAIQDITTYGDEFTIALMAQLKNLGVHTDRLESATKMVLGLAAATGRSTETMIMAVAAYEEGDAELLRRYIPALRGTTDATEKLALVSALSAKGFKVLQERARGTRSALIQMWNVIGDIAEKIGAALLPRIKAVAGSVKDWAASNQELIATRFGEWIDTISGTLKSLAPIFTAVGKRPKLFLATIYALIAAPFVPLLLLIGKGFVGLVKAAWAANIAFKIWGKRAYIAFWAAGAGAGKATRLQSLYTRAVWASSDAIRILRFRVLQLKAAYLAATVAGKAMMLVGFGLWVTAIAIAATLLFKIGKQLLIIKKAFKELGKKDTIDQRIAAYKKEHGAAIKAAKARHAATRKRIQLDKDELNGRRELAKQEVDKSRLEAQLAFLEKVGGKYRDIAKLKRDLLKIEAEETAEATGGDPLEIRRGLHRKAIALQRAADREASEERRAEYREKLETLKNLFEGEARFAKDLSVIKRKLRHEEALDVQKAAPWLDIQAIKAMLKAKESPVEIARAGLQGIESAWGQIATGTQRTQEEQLRALQGIRQSVERQEELAEAGRGMSTTATPRY